MQSATDVLREAQECHLAGDFARAEYLYCKLISHSEEHPAAYFLLGTLYAQLHLHGRALTFLKRAIELQPNANGAMENLAAVYREMENRDKARDWGLKALAIEKTAIALSNMSGTFINDGHPEEALKWANEAIAMEPIPQALNHKALALLEMGRFEEGWAVYDARLNLPQIHRRPFTCPMWDSKPVKKLAIHGEQGLGDEILFLTCLKQLRHLAQDVAIEVSPRLVRLMQNSFPDCQVYGKHEDLPFEPDAWIAMGSLPGLCWPVVPNAYLKPALKLSKAWPEGRQRPSVGLSWKGGTVATHEALRNAPIALWRQFLDLGCVSLQYGDEAHNAEALGLVHDAEGIADLDTLAAMVKSCDLVISVCNTTVHMAGALGVPCIALVPSAPAWRYGLTGEKMAWYDSVVMVRQAEGEKWDSVFARAKTKAVEILNAHHRQLPRAEPATA